MVNPFIILGVLRTFSSKGWGVHEMHVDNDHIRRKLRFI